MSRPISAVLACLDDQDLLERHLPPLFEEFRRRAAGDEVLVVDDTGDDVLAAWLAERFPEERVRCLAQTKNAGFANAMFNGFSQAEHPLVFGMNPDVLVRPGFLDPLVACFDEDDVHAVVPRVLLNGESDAIESLFQLRFANGEVTLEQPALGERAADDEPLPIQPTPMVFPVGGAALFRRDVFLERGGFDELFLPFYWEDVDYGWTTWRLGGRVLYQPASVVEHHHRGTIGRVVPKELVRAAIEKNRLLFQWKHLDEQALRDEHLPALYRFAIDAWLGDYRDELVWLALALEESEAALDARATLGDEPRFDEILRFLSQGPRR